MQEEMHPTKKRMTSIKDASLCSGRYYLILSPPSDISETKGRLPAESAPPLRHCALKVTHVIDLVVIKVRMDRESRRRVQYF
jgi:hypothetical protein